MLLTLSTRFFFKLGLVLEGYQFRVFLIIEIQDEDDIAEPDDEDVDPEPGRPPIRPISPPLELVGPVRPVGPVGRVGPVGHHPMSVKNEDPDPIATN